MVEYTKEQQQIARSLLKGPKTIEELRKDLNMPTDEILKHLKELIKLKVVEKSGFPTKYKLLDVIVNRVKSGKESRLSDYPYEVLMIIEGMSSDKEALEKQMQMLKEKIESEKGIDIIKLNLADVVKNENNFTTFISLQFGCETFADLIRMIIQYGPSSVEILAPQEAELSIREMQEISNDVMSAVHYYITLIVQLKQAMGKMAEGGHLNK
ncbi:hypothetical protein DRN74_02065 [Candidatus Micrarchaeota archaeon]|nr:MAG: hypothetical protein DRN74_02065 [Candidatus Micrarchaeota archaeon]